MSTQRICQLSTTIATSPPPRSPRIKNGLISPTFGSEATTTNGAPSVPMVSMSGLLPEMPLPAKSSTPMPLQCLLFSETLSSIGLTSNSPAFSIFTTCSPLLPPILSGNKLPSSSPPPASPHALLWRSQMSVSSVQPTILPTLSNSTPPSAIPASPSKCFPLGARIRLSQSIAPIFGIIGSIVSRFLPTPHVAISTT